MKHPDDVAKEMADVAAQHGYGLVSATLSGPSIVGIDVPRYVYGAESLDTLTDDGWHGEMHQGCAEDHARAPAVAINIPEGYESVTKTVGDISTTTVRPMDRVEQHTIDGKIIARYVPKPSPD